MDWIKAAIENYVSVLTKKYALFTGRARRREYWLFFAVNITISIVLSLIDALIGTGILGTLFGLAVLLPGIGLTIRRLHDTNRSGWWILISLVPILGLIALLVFMTQDSTPGQNQYGDNPKGA